MKKFFQEFAAFIKRGNVLDLAVGLIIGGAFNAIVKSLVNDLIMPLLSLVIGDNFSLLKFVLIKEQIDNVTGAIITNEVAIRYGAFIQTIVDFLLIGLSIFVAIRIITKVRAKLDLAKQKLLKKEDEEKKDDATVEIITPPQPTSEELLQEIRDLLKESTKKTDG